MCRMPIITTCHWVSYFRLWGVIVSQCFSYNLSLCLMLSLIMCHCVDLFLLSGFSVGHASGYQASLCLMLLVTMCHCAWRFCLTCVTKSPASCYYVSLCLMLPVGTLVFTFSTMHCYRGQLLSCVSFTVWLSLPSVTPVLSLSLILFPFVIGYFLDWH